MLVVYFLYRLSDGIFYVLDCSVSLARFFVVVYDNYFQCLEDGQEFVDFFLGVVVVW